MCTSADGMVTGAAGREAETRPRVSLGFEQLPKVAEAKDEAEDDVLVHMSYSAAVCSTRSGLWPNSTIRHRSGQPLREAPAGVSAGLLRT